MSVPNTMRVGLVAMYIAGSLAPAALAGGKPEKERPASNPRPTIVHTGREFHWSDAAIGAAAGFGAAVAAAGGITLGRNR